MRRALLALTMATLAGCESAGPRPVKVLARLAAADLPRIEATSDPLAHEGGIVYLKPLSDIQDAVARAAAETLGLEMATELRARRAMREAALLAEGTVAATVQVATGYRLSQLGAPGTIGFGFGAKPGMPPPKPPAPWYMGDPGPGPVAREKLHDAARMEAGDAFAAWGALGPDDHAKAEAAWIAREKAYAQKLGQPFIKRAGKFLREGEERSSPLDGGGREVATVFQLPERGAVHTIQVKRAFDERGGLLQSKETLQGKRGMLDVDCERIRTRLPDGAELEASDARFLLDGRAHQVRWSRRLDAEGRMAGVGRIVRPDGHAIELASAIGEDGLEVITGQDATSGVAVTVRGGIEAPRATVTLDAGPAGSAIFEVTLDAAAD